MTQADIIDVEGRELVVTPVTALADSRAPAQIIKDAQERAKVVADIIASQGLFKLIKGKRYVFYEGWCTLAAQYGLVPGIEWSRPLQGGGFEAKAELRRMDTGVVVATADAECGTAGDGEWCERASYAQRSMAETRAVSKVCRVALSWVIVLAGYAATPAEEVPDGGFDNRPSAPAKPQNGRPAPPRPQTSGARKLPLSRAEACTKCDFVIPKGQDAYWEAGKGVWHLEGQCQTEFPSDDPGPQEPA